MPLLDSLRELAWRRACHNWIEDGKKGPCGPDECEPFYQELKEELTAYKEGGE
jgi:hypothetical protein